MFDFVSQLLPLNSCITFANKRSLIAVLVLMIPALSFAQSVTPTKARQKMYLIAENVLQDELQGRSVFMMPLSFPVRIQNRPSHILSRLTVLEEEGWLTVSKSVDTQSLNDQGIEKIKASGQLEFTLTPLGRDFYVSEMGFHFGYVNFLGVEIANLPTSSDEVIQSTVTYRWQITEPQEWIWAPAFDTIPFIRQVRADQDSVFYSTATLVKHEDAWMLMDSGLLIEVP